MLAFRWAFLDMYGRLFVLQGVGKMNGIFYKGEINSSKGILTYRQKKSVIVK